MKYVVYVILALGMLALTFFLYVRVKKGGVPGMLTKTLTSVFFILTAVTAFIANKNVDTTFGALIIMGLVFGLIGDVVLDLKYCYPQDNDIYTFTGMGSFALGHICYLLAIYLTYYGQIGNKLVTLLVPIAVGITFGSGAVFGGPKLGMDYGKFKIPALTYGILLSFMMCTNIIFCIYDPSIFWILMAIGGVMFIASDLVLSQTYFVFKNVMDEEGNQTRKLIYENKPVLVIIIHITYYAAQFLIALALLFQTPLVG